MAKGGDFERYIAKQLTVWLTGKPKPYMFWRMPASGGLATIHEECVGLAGDIRSVHKDAEFLTNIFSIECKTGYPHTSFWQHFKNIKNFNLELFWLQACGESMGSNRRPMLIYRKKGNKPLVGITEDIISELQEVDDLTEIPSVCMYWPVIKNIQPMHLFNFEDFLEAVSPDDIKEAGHQLGVWEWLR
jgi:hypothetical protein